jgi:hypothetical protein
VLQLRELVARAHEPPRVAARVVERATRAIGRVRQETPPERPVVLVVRAVLRGRRVREEKTAVERRLRVRLHRLSQLVAGLRERREVLRRRVLREELLELVVGGEGELEVLVHVVARAHQLL